MINPITDLNFANLIASLLSFHKEMIGTELICSSCAAGTSIQ
ncbi:MAG: hypothetical protein JETT_3525 [Candidatus Jettenia ecosi]|uniref:Uncharacterized protein n=1 Tax=Candidatus Jettenia ecosi TaxID=2494326 RepID=A0A533QI13_9BACT|nr:MAG: hypothetical protein JETT_3525 [Candidatus Jettenia ecosi]